MKNSRRASGMNETIELFTAQKIIVIPKSALMRTNQGIETSAYRDALHRRRCFCIESYLQILANRRINASCDKNRRRLNVFDFSAR